MSNTTVVQYLFNEEWAPLVESLNSAPQLKVEDLQGNPQDIVTFLSGEESALIFISLASKDDLVALANLVKMSRKVLRDVPHKFIVVNFTGNKNVERAIMKMGILDILDANLKSRALRFKIDFWVKSLAHSVKNKPLADNKREVKKTETAQTEKKNDVPLWINPLELESDIWLVKNELEIKKILGRWLVKLMGPSSHVATWVEVEGQSNFWRFQVKDSYRSDLHVGDGDWFFRGDNKPDYNWKEHLWTMAGDKIELIYLYDKKITPRFVIKDKVLHIAKNSDYAKTKIQIIEETFKQEHIFKKDAEAADIGRGIEAEDELPGHLKGKSSTENLGNDNQSGKSKTGSDNLSDMSGKGSTDSLDYGAMKGKNKGDQSESGYLDGEIKKESVRSEKDSDDSLSYLENKKKSHLNGKSSTDSIEENYSNANNKRSSFVDSDINDKKSNSHSEKENNGKEGSAGKNQYNAEELSEENKHKNVDKFYKNHNEATSYEGKDLSGKGKRSDEIDGHLSSLEKNKKSASDSQDSEDDYKRFKEGSANDLSGKGGRADELDGHLSSKDKSSFEDKKQNATKGSEGYHDKLGNDLSGKGSRADDLNGHLTSKEKQNRISRDNNSSATESYQEKNLQKSTNDENSSSDKKNRDLKSSSSSSNNESNEAEDSIYHPSANLDSFSGTGEKKKKTSDTNAANNSEPPVNIYPIRPSLNEGESFLDTELEDEKLDAGESSLVEISQTAKIYSFISQGSIKRLCDLDDYFDDIVMLRVSGGDFVELQKVQLDLSFHYLKEKTPLKVEGIIEGIDPDENNFVFVTVRLKNEEVTNFEKFITKFQKRQSNIDQFMKRAKGL